MDPITIALSVALAQGLVQVGQKLLEKGVVEPALEPATSRLKKWVTGPYARKEKDQALLNAVQAALKETGVPVDDEDSLAQWGRDNALWRLQEGDNAALRRQIARTVLTFTGPAEEPPPDLLIALGWPNGRRAELGCLLIALRAQLYELPDWRAPIEYANAAQEQGLLTEMRDSLARWDNLYVKTEAGEALRVALVQQGMSEEEVTEIEERYRQDLVRKLRMHSFRGIFQLKRAPRLPLADIYLELGLLKTASEPDQRQRQKVLADWDEEKRLAEEEHRLRDRVSDALAHSPRLIILGGPGSGKTVSLRFISLMLAYGYGASRLGLNRPYIPLMVRLADYARELEQKPHLSLDNFLLQYIGEAYASDARLGDFLRWGLEQGACMVLLDGLDEVGDDPVKGRSLRAQVVQQVQAFGDVWCGDDRQNRLVVTSRTEGYWRDSLQDFVHVELSPLRPPDEVEAFLLRWFTAYEMTQQEELSLDEAEGRAEKRVGALLPRIMGWTSTRHLATNPLLLTILALIHEMGGKLPNDRANLYDRCTRTLIESWRQMQTGRKDMSPANLKWNKVMRIMASLAYWMHEKYPGGTAPLEEWQAQLRIILVNAGLEEKADLLTEHFLSYARQQAGLLVERSQGQYGFFHLTLEEYMAGWWLSRQREKVRRQMLRSHWQDANWREVILLTAGQLGAVDADEDSASDFVMDLLLLEPEKLEDEGRPAVLAGRALADIGLDSVGKKTRQYVKDALRQTMQDVDPEMKRPRTIPPYTSVRTRYEAGEVLDELGWLPDELNAWLPCPGCAENGGDLRAMKYLVTNAQFARFIAAGGYENSAYWGGEDGEAWQWRVKGERRYSSAGTDEPEYWRDPRFGQEHRGFPIVGVSWYEANAYCRWLTELLHRARDSDAALAEADQALVTDLLRVGAAEIRLPVEAEWEKMAGGTKAADRYPWDDPDGPATNDEAEIIRRANTSEANISGTSPVGMYSLGQSKPYGLMDLAGNVWEWMQNERGLGRARRGGSWRFTQWGARVSDGPNYDPRDSGNHIGFRPVSPVDSGS